MTVAFPTRILEELQSYLLFFSQEFLKNIDETSSDKKTTTSINFFCLKSRWLENKSERLEKQPSTAHYSKFTYYVVIAKHVKPVSLTDWMFLSIMQKSIKYTYLWRSFLYLCPYEYTYVIIMYTNVIVCISFYCRRRSNYRIDFQILHSKSSAHRRYNSWWNIEDPQYLILFLPKGVQ